MNDHSIFKTFSILYPPFVSKIYKVDILLPTVLMKGFKHKPDIVQNAYNDWVKRVENLGIEGWGGINAEFSVLSAVYTIRKVNALHRGFNDKTFNIEAEINPLVGEDNIKKLTSVLEQFEHTTCFIMRGSATIEYNEVTELRFGQTTLMVPFMYGYEASKKKIFGGLIDKYNEYYKEDISDINTLVKEIT